MSRTEKTIFLAALERETPADRARFLEEACGDDRQLRAEVDALLRAHDETDHFLDEGVAAGEMWAAATAIDTSSHAAERPGTVIGPYRLMEQIGEGGFALVFVAEQQEPVRRKVALKVLKPGMDSRDVIARFEAERQALAMMVHPNIARVFDAGASPSGRPYFVMELVRGVPITEFCDRQRLDTTQRLELFITVCNAIEHAHQKGIIHRDLKPSNILVTMHDGAPVAKVIDFGIAKALGQTLTDKTIYTRFAAMIGTPLYMSPEQAEMTSGDIDTRSDIYSLGVLLYELLTGQTPFARERMASGTFDEIRRIIREEEPPRPSARLSTTANAEALSTVSANRRTEPRQLSGMLKGDLDWIVMKSLDKDRGRRYQTASALAADVKRYLNNDPVEARPPSPVYRFRKFALRNKVVLTTTVLVALSLLLGTAVAVWQAALATSERDEKVRALAEAQAATRKLDQLNDLLTSTNKQLAAGRSYANRDQWAAASAEYTQATVTLADYYIPWLERGTLYAQLGLWQLAADDFSQALRLDAPVQDTSWNGVPQLLWYVGDDAAYQKFADQFMLTSPRFPHELSMNELRGFLVADVPGVDPRALSVRADELLREDQRRPPGGPFSPGRRPPPEGPPHEGPPRDGRPPRDERGPRRDWGAGRRDGPPGDRDRRPPDERGPRRNGFRPHHGPGPDRPPQPRDGSPRDRAQNRLPHGVSLYVAGWAAYRAGDFGRAIELLNRSKVEDRSWPGRGLNDPLLAMAYHRAGRSEEAKQMLATANATYENWVDEIAAAPVGKWPVPWFDWIEFMLLRRKANRLLTGRVGEEDTRLAEIHARALAAIRGEEVQHDR